MPPQQGGAHASSVFLARSGPPQGPALVRVAGLAHMPPTVVQPPVSAATQVHTATHPRLHHALCALQARLGQQQGPALVRIAVLAHMPPTVVQPPVSVAMQVHTATHPRLHHALCALQARSGPQQGPALVRIAVLACILRMGQAAVQVVVLARILLLEQQHPAKYVGQDHLQIACMSHNAHYVQLGCTAPPTVQLHVFHVMQEHTQVNRMPLSVYYVHQEPLLII